MMRRRLLGENDINYNAVKWISGGATDEVTNGTCWIDTGFMFGPGMILTLDMEFTNVPFYCSLLGTETFKFEAPNEISVFLVVDGNRYPIFRYVNKNTLYHIMYIADKGKGYLYNVDGECIKENAVDIPLSTTNILYLFKSHPEDTRFANYHFYGLTITDIEGALLLDLHPVLDSGGVPCVYDTVSKQYLYNGTTRTLRYETLEGEVVNA